MAKCGSMRWATFQAMAFSTSKRRGRSAESVSGGDMRSWLTSRTCACDLDAAPFFDVEAADDDEIGVEGLGDADGGGAAGAEAGGKAEMIERVLAVVAADGEEAGGGEALVEGVGEGIADPAEGGLAGAVVEGQDQDKAATGLANVCGRVGGCGRRVRNWRLGLYLAVGYGVCAQSGEQEMPAGSRRRIKLGEILTTIGRL